MRAILYPAIPPPWGAFEQGRPWVLWSKLLGTVRKQRGGGGSWDQGCACAGFLGGRGMAQSLSSSPP